MIEAIGAEIGGTVRTANRLALAANQKPANAANKANKANAANTDVSRLDGALARIESLEARVQSLEGSRGPSGGTQATIREVPIVDVVMKPFAEEHARLAALQVDAAERSDRKAYMRELMRKKRAAAKLRTDHV